MTSAGCGDLAIERLVTLDSSTRARDLARLDFHGQAGHTMTMNVDAIGGYPGVSEPAA